MNQLNTWHTVTLGICQTPTAYKAAFRVSGHRIGAIAREILPKITCAEIQTDLRLARLTVGELGLVEGGTWKQIHDAIRKIDGELCPAEVALALREHYPDQPTDEYLLIAMEPIADDDDTFVTLSVEHRDNETWLCTCGADPTIEWSPADQIVFVLPTQVSLTT